MGEERGGRGERVGSVKQSQLASNMWPGPTAISDGQRSLASLDTNCKLRSNMTARLEGSAPPPCSQCSQEHVEMELELSQPSLQNNYCLNLSLH